MKGGWDGTEIAFIKNEKVNNVLNFGADPTGTGDSSPAFQAAHDALPLEGGSIYVPHGKYILNSTVNIKKYVHVFGEGSGDLSSQLIANNPSMGIMFDLQPMPLDPRGGSNLTYALPCFEKLQFYGKGYTVKAIKQEQGSAIDIRFEDIWFDSFADDVVTLVEYWDHSFLKCVFEHNTARCVVCTQESGYTTSFTSAFFTDCFFLNNKYCILVCCGTVTIKGCIFNASGNKGGDLGDGYDVKLDSVKTSIDTTIVEITGNTFVNSWYDSIRVSPSAQNISANISGNVFEGFGKAGANCIHFVAEGTLANTRLTEWNISNNDGISIYNFINTDGGFPGVMSIFNINNNSMQGNGLGKALTLCLNQTGYKAPNDLHVLGNIFTSFSTGLELYIVYHATILNNTFDTVTTPWSVLPAKPAGNYPIYMDKNYPDPSWDCYEGTTNSSGQYTLPTMFKSGYQTYKPQLLVTLEAGGFYWNVVSWGQTSNLYSNVTIQVYNASGVAVGAGVALQVRVIPRS